MDFVFACAAAGDNCTYKNKVISMQLFQHFSAQHGNLLPADNKLAQLLFNGAEPRKPSRADGGGSKPRPKKIAVAVADSNNYGDCSDEFAMDRNMNYTIEMIRYLKANSIRPTYRCLVALRSQWKILNGSG